MGIYINMERPKRGMVINLYTDGRVTNHFDEFGEIIGKAMPVPPHGPLIDMNKILEYKYITIPPHRKEYADGKRKSEDEIIAFKHGWNSAIDAIVANAPIIIEAEEDEL